MKKNRCKRKSLPIVYYGVLFGIDMVIGIFLVVNYLI